MISAFMPEYWTFILCRTVVGFGIGLGVPVAASFVTEVCPAKYRGAYMISFQLFFIIGTIIIIVSAFIFTPDLEEGNWRALLVIAASPLAIDCVLIFWLVESPFYLARH